MKGVWKQRPPTPYPTTPQPHSHRSWSDFASSYDARPLSDSGTPVSHQAPASVQVE